MSVDLIAEVIKHPIEAVGVVSSLIGSFYITAKDKRAFLFWFVGNVAMFIVVLGSGLVLMSIMYAYYILNSAYGYYNWNKLEKWNKMERRNRLDAANNEAMSLNKIDINTVRE